MPKPPARCAWIDYELTYLEDHKDTLQELVDDYAPCPGEKGYEYEDLQRYAEAMRLYLEIDRTMVDLFRIRNRA